MKRKNFLIAGGIVALMIAYLIWANFLKTGPSMRKLEAQYQLDAVAFYNEFETDESTANAKYLNKIVQVTGEVSNVEVNEGSKPVISLKTEGFGVIKCTMETELTDDQLSIIRSSPTIVIKAECIGMLLDVLLNRGIIEEN